MTKAHKEQMDPTQAFFDSLFSNPIEKEVLEGAMERRDPDEIIAALLDRKKGGAQ